MSSAKVSPEAVAIDRLGAELKRLTTAHAELAGELRNGIARADRERNLLAQGLETRDDAIEKLQAEVDDLRRPPSAEVEAGRLDFLAKAIAKILSLEIAAEAAVQSARLNDAIEKLRGVTAIVERLDHEDLAALDRMDATLLDKIERLEKATLPDRVAYLEGLPSRVSAMVNSLQATDARVTEAFARAETIEAAGREAVNDLADRISALGKKK